MELIRQGVRLAGHLWGLAISQNDHQGGFENHSFDIIEVTQKVNRSIS